MAKRPTKPAQNATVANLTPPAARQNSIVAGIKGLQVGAIKPAPGSMLKKSKKERRDD